MYPAKSLFTKVVMNMFGAFLTSVSVLGNSFVLATIARFKSLRTVPNILIANLAVVDLLYAAVNLPFHMISNSEASWYRGQTLAIVTAFLSRVFAILNLASMLAMMANVFLAIAFDFKYLAWKTKKKVMICVVLIWLISLVVTILGSIPLLNINLADARVRDYRAEIYKQGKYFVGSLTGFSIVRGGVLGFLTTRAIKKNEKKVSVRFSAHFCSLPFLDVLVFNFKRICSRPANTQRVRSESVLEYEHALNEPLYSGA